MPVRLSDLSEPIRSVAASASLSSIIRKFTSQADIQCIAILEKGRPLGILTRTRAMELAATSDESVNRRLCVGDVVEAVPQLAGNMTAFSFVMNRHLDDFSHLESGALVLKDDKIQGLLSLPALLKGVAREQASSPEAVIEKRSGAASDGPYDPRGIATLLGTLAHEVRTPLTGIMGLADIMQQRLRDPELKEMADTIIRSSEALNRILSDTLDFAAYQAGDLQLSPEPSNIFDLVTDLRRLWRPVAAGKGLGFKVSFRSTLGGLVDVDQGRLRQVANNLISNALKFTESGRVDVEFVLERQSNAALQLRLSVSDTGRGLSPAQKKSLFEFFSRGDATHDQPGWGLGLAICSGLSRHLGGKLKVLDRPEGGTVFSVCIPVQPIRQSCPDGSRGDGVRSGKFRLGRVLLVEDHEACAMIFRTAIERAGWQVDHVHSLNEAGTCLEHQSYQAVLTDLHLLDGSGLTLIEALRQRCDMPEDSAIIALTADTRVGVTSLALAHGADRVVTKPVRGPDLVAQLSEVLIVRRKPGDDVTESERDVAV